MIKNDGNNNHRRRIIRRMWKIHFSIGLAVLCFGMLCNGGRKYVQVDPTKAPTIACNRLFVNVYSSSQEDHGATICCTDHLEQWPQVFSYEGFLCNTQIRAIPFSRSMTRFPDSWLLPLIPIFLRLMVSLFEFLGSTLKATHDSWASIKRMCFYICIFQFRGWGLYICLNMLVEIVVGMETKQGILDTCWYSPLLKSRWQDDPCHGIPFDFSDHVVLFFSHHFPTFIFEATICFLFPFWSMKPRAMSRMGGAKTGSQKTSSVRSMLHALLMIILSGVFVYLNVITLLAIHSTAAYFHSVTEVIIGYIISLIVQLPVGYIIWKDSWKSAQKLVGFPPVRNHAD